MTGLTIEELLKGHTIEKGSLRLDQKVRSGWVLDSYGQPFPHKVYAAIAAVTIDATEMKLHYSDLKRYALRVVTAEGSENYFKGERGFTPIEEEKTDFSLELANMKSRLASAAHLTMPELEAIITGSDLRELEMVGRMPLREFGMELADIAKGAFSYMKNRKQAHYLKPIHDPKASRTEHYTLVLKGSRS